MMRLRNTFRNDFFYLSILDSNVLNQQNAKFPTEGGHANLLKCFCVVSTVFPPPFFVSRYSIGCIVFFCAHC
jgi:hypothetical protein